MVDTQEAKQSEYINAETVENSETKKFVVLGEGEYEETKFGDRLTVPVEMDGKRKKWRPNKASTKEVDKQLNVSNTKDWVEAIVSVAVTGEGNYSSIVVVKAVGIQKRG